MADDRFVTHLTPCWANVVPGDTRPLVARVQPLVQGAMWECLLGIRDENGRQSLFSFPVRDGEPIGEWSEEHKQWTSMTCWGLRRLGPSVWTIQPSVQATRVLHAYITLIDVPEPAPFVGG